MRKPLALATAMLGFALAAALVPTVASRHQPAPGPSGPLSGTHRTSDLLATLPLAFEPSGTGFVSRGPGYSVVLTPSETVMRLGTGRELRMRLVGANTEPAVAGRNPLPGTANYLVGDDPSAWRTAVPTFAGVEHRGVYPGVDLVFHGNQRRLEHDFVVAPGADPGAVVVEFDADRLTIDTSGDLVATVAGGPVRLAAPVLYQDVGGARHTVAGSYVGRGGNRVGFEVGRYDPALPLVIDPVLVTSTYLGGSGNETAHSVDVDSAGNIYLTGSTESADLTTAAPLQARLNQDGTTGRPDAFVAKIDPAANSLVYATYLGGSSRDVGFSVAVGADNSAYVTGVTESANFPTARPIQPAFGGGSSDAFVARLSPDGASLLYGTFVGGRETDGGRGIDVDRQGNAYFTGSTSSPDFRSVGSFPAGPVRPDDVDAFVAKVNAAGSAFDYSARLGGSNDDNGVDVAVDGNGNAVVTGDTRSPGFPTARPYQPGSGGSASGVGGSFADAFVSKVDPAGGALVYSTFLGGSDSDLGSGIALDTQGNAYITGSTSSVDFPTAGTTRVQGRKDGDTDAFVSKLDPNGATLVYSSYLGGNGADAGTSVAVDGNGVASVAGTASSTNFPTASAIQGAKGGGQSDAFVAQFDPAGAVLVSSSYLGGRDDDQGAAVALAPDGTVVVAGVTNSPDFRTIKPLQAARTGSGGDAFVLTIAEGQAAAPVEPAPSRTSHQRRVRFLVGSTAALFLAAVLHTAYLRRRASSDSEWQPGPEIPAPPRHEKVGSGVRVLDDRSDEQPAGEETGAGDETLAVPPAAPVTATPPRARPTRADRHAKNRRAPAPVTTSAPVDEVPVPDLLDETQAGQGNQWWDRPPEDDLVPPPPPRPPAARPVAPQAAPLIPPLPAEDLSFWDLFPEDLPVPSGPPGAPADPWSPDYPADDLLAERHPSPPPGGEAPRAEPPSARPAGREVRRPPVDDDAFWAADLASAPPPKPPTAAPAPPPPAPPNPVPPPDELLITEFLADLAGDPAPVATPAPAPNRAELAEMLADPESSDFFNQAPPSALGDDGGDDLPAPAAARSRSGENGEQPVRKRQRARRSGRRKRPDG